MVLLDQKLIVLGGKSEPVLTWEVWWATPLGLTKDLDEALEMQEKLDTKVDAIRAVPVAVSETMYEPL